MARTWRMVTKKGLKVRLNTVDGQLEVGFTCPRCGREQSQPVALAELNDDGRMRVLCENTRVCGAGGENFYFSITIDYDGEYVRPEDEPLQA